MQEHVQVWDLWGNCGKYKEIPVQRHYTFTKILIVQFDKDKLDQSLELAQKLVSYLPF